MKHEGKLSVSLMCADLLNMEPQIRTFEKCGVDYLHIDIMDASFVPNLTFGPDFVNAVQKKTTLPLDIHLLMEYPRVIIRSIDIKENDIVSIHSDCKDNPMEIAALIKHKGSRFGIALNPDTEIESVTRFLPYADVILLMLIVPGFAGSAMIHGIMEKVGRTRKYLNEIGYDNIEISIDGSVSCERAKYMRSLGASIFVGGTAGIFRKGIDIKESISELKRNIL